MGFILIFQLSRSTLEKILGCLIKTPWELNEVCHGSTGEATGGHSLVDFGNNYFEVMD